MIENIYIILFSYTMINKPLPLKHDREEIVFCDSDNTFSSYFHFTKRIPKVY